MNFQSERTAVNLLSDTIVKSGVSLYNAIKYIYSMADTDFYTCNIKDVLKVVLNNLTDTNCLQSLGLIIDNGRCREMNTPEYNKVLSLIVYSFAVRIPLLKTIKVDNQTMTDEQLKMVYDRVIEKGAENYKDYIEDKYDEIRKLVKANKPVGAYSSEWYKTFILTNIPALSQINNKNIFLLGAVDILFTMFYACLEGELESIIINLDKA